MQDVVWAVENMKSGNWLRKDPESGKLSWVGDWYERTLFTDSKEAKKLAESYLDTRSVPVRRVRPKPRKQSAENLNDLLGV